MKFFSQLRCWQNGVLNVLSVRFRFYFTHALLRIKFLGEKFGLNLHKYKGTIKQMAVLLNSRIPGMDELLLPMEQMDINRSMACTEPIADHMAEMKPKVLQETSSKLAEASI